MYATEMAPRDTILIRGLLKIGLGVQAILRFPFGKVCNIGIINIQI
jgi:hypothetical protein